MAKTTQTQIKRAVAGVQKAGVVVGRVEIDRDGKIVVVAASDAKVGSTNALDEWRQRRARKA